MKCVFLFFFHVIICRKTIPLIILEEGSYEKDVLFYVNLGEPQMVGGNTLIDALLFVVVLLLLFLYV